ncbi:MAG: hypothetical protein ABR907_06670 [Terracidiphilus sp.]|jgi:hypothetical protein
MHRIENKFWKLKIVLGTGTFFVLFSSATLAATSITGIVRNQTNDRPAVGDEVILLVGQEAQEEARTKTDSQGSFALELHHSDKPHVVRVIHQGVNYDKQVFAGYAISIDVADVATKINGITGGIEIIRTGTQGNLLHVSDMIEIKNLSNPPVTQASRRTFEVYLPGQAKIDSVLAAGPDNIGAMISALPVRDDPGHYTVNFPLRPGATKFAFNYDLPYDGRATFHTKSIYPMQQLAVMIPPTMSFVPRSSAFQILPVGNGRYHVEAAEQLKAGERLEFEVSGVGALPPMQAQPHASPQAKARELPNFSASTVTVTSFSSSSSFGTQNPSGNALSPVAVSKVSAPLSLLQWWTVGAGVMLIIGTCGALVWRRRHSHTGTVLKTARAERGGQTTTSMIEALKEGLFLLESDRVQGVIPREEYASVKLALEGTIEWAMARPRTFRGITSD